MQGTRLVDLDAPIRLLAGETYTLLADNWLQDEYVSSFSNFFDEVRFDPAVTWIDGVTGASNSIFSSVSPAFTEPGLLGPNFAFDLVPAGVVGDYSGDGTVGPEDYSVWAATVGSQGSGLAADGNGDQVVDTADYAVWRDSLEGDAAGTVVIPEPSAAVMGAIACLLAAAIRR